MKRKVLRIGGCILLCFMLVFGLTACKDKTNDEENLAQLDFTVVTHDDIPEEFLKMIDEQKKQDFKLTYQSEGWLYIARGYGTQNSGGYSIAVKELSLADNAVYFDSELIGPQPGEAVNKLVTYPFVVVKTEDVGKTVVFR